MLPLDPRDWTVAAVAAELGMVGDPNKELAAVDERGYRQRLRNGRVVAAPVPWLRKRLDAAKERVLLQLVTNPHSYSRRGRGIIEQAKKHLGQPYVATLDIQSCFPSTSVRMIRRALGDAKVPADVVRLLTRLVTFRGYLPQGAPTSSLILEIVLAPIDRKLHVLATRHGARYTRFADDLAFSSARPLESVTRAAARVVRGAGYSLSNQKHNKSGPGERHIITGISVRDSLRPRPGYVARLRKQLRKPNSANAATSTRLRGKKQWVRSLNPELAQSLEE